MSTKEQKVFDVTIIERKEILHTGSGVVQEITREVLYDAKVPAVTAESAKQKALAELKATADSLEKTMNFDDLEITCNPFCG